jgi:hypothetical protein
MALRLGLARETLIDLLKQLGANEPGGALTAERFAAAMTRPDQRLVVNVTSTISPAEEKVSGESDAAPPGQSTVNGSRVRSSPPETRQVERTILEESKRLQVACGVVAGDNIVLGAARITCGPGEEDIDAIVSRLIAQADVDELVGDLRRGALTHTELLGSLEEELSLSRSTVLQLLKRIADAQLPPGRAAAELETLTKQHVSLVYQLGQLPTDDPDAGELRDMVAAAVAAGEFAIAEALLLQWSQLQQVDGKLVAVRKELAKPGGEREIKAGEPEDRVPGQGSERPELTITAAPGSTPGEAGQQIPVGETGALFVSQDRVVLDSPASVSAGAVMSFAWRGPAAPDDLIFIAKIDVVENRYPTSDKRRHKAGQGSPATLTAPAEPGVYEIRYFSYNNGEALARVPLEVTAGQVSLMTPSRISAGSVIEFEWRGPDAPGDLLFIARPDMASNRYHSSDRQRHATRKGAPATLVVPAEKGDYEIRYFSYNNATVLTSKPLEVLAAEVKLSAPETVSPGAHMKFPWQGPNAPGDLIFIVKPDRPQNEYPISDRQRHRTSEGTVAELVAPAKPGRYEIRYFSFANGAALGAQSLTVQ